MFRFQKVGKGRSMSWIVKIIFVGQVEAGGKAEEETS